MSETVSIREQGDIVLRSLERYASGADDIFTESARLAIPAARALISRCEKAERVAHAYKLGGSDAAAELNSRIEALTNSLHASAADKKETDLHYCRVIKRWRLEVEELEAQCRELGQSLDGARAARDAAWEEIAELRAALSEIRDCCENEPNAVEAATKASLIAIRFLAVNE